MKEKRHENLGIEFWEYEIYYSLMRKKKEHMKNGIYPHMKKIPKADETPEYVRMNVLAYGKKVLSLKSQKFETYDQAKHFSDCFNDSFLSDSFCKEENGAYYVYSNWLVKDDFISYERINLNRYYEFANWS